MFHAADSAAPVFHPPNDVAKHAAPHAAGVGIGCSHLRLLPRLLYIKLGAQLLGALAQAVMDVPAGQVVWVRQHALRRHGLSDLLQGCGRTHGLIAHLACNGIHSGQRCRHTHMHTHTRLCAHTAQASIGSGAQAGLCTGPSAHQHKPRYKHTHRSQGKGACTSTGARAGTDKHQPSFCCERASFQCHVTANACL